MRRSLCVWAALVSILGGVGCGGKNVGSAVRPADPTAASVLNESQCHDVAGKAGEPLIVGLRKGCSGGDAFACAISKMAK